MTPLPVAGRHLTDRAAPIHGYSFDRSSAKHGYPWHRSRLRRRPGSTGLQTRLVRTVSFEFPEPLAIGGTVYHLHARPLEGFLQERPDWPRFPDWPCNTRGYSASWAIIDGMPCLTDLRAPIEGALTTLFPGIAGPVPARWANGIVMACRGARRHVGHPLRIVHDEELYVELDAGYVVREWRLDLRALPGPSDTELRLSLPRFLWPAHLRAESRPDAGQ